MIQFLGLPIYVFICLLFLAMLSIIDIKTYKIPKGAIPSLLTILFIIAIFISVEYPQNIQMGIFALIIGLALADLGMYYGIADLKIIIAVGMTFYDMISFLTFALILSFFSLIIKYIVKKKYHKRELPFIPIIFLTYIICVIIGIIIKTFI